MTCLIGGLFLRKKYIFEVCTAMMDFWQEEVLVVVEEKE